MIIVGDIGGTKADLAICEMDGPFFKCIKKTRYATQHYNSFIAILNDFIGSGTLQGLNSCFGVAGPIQNGKSQVVNIKWPLISQEIIQYTGLSTAWLINDLEAIAYGVGALRETDLIFINKGSEEYSTGNAAVIAAGTGLGEAGLIWNGHAHQPVPSEGGHCNFAPTNEEEIELLRYISKRLGGHVSYERVVSGPGITLIYEFLRDSGKYDEPEWLKQEMIGQDTTVVIAKHALDNTSQICVRALDIFIANYGAEAGNLALKFLTHGGIYVAGGIAPKILPKMQSNIFLNAFLSKGRFRSLLETFPVKIINNRDINLLGAARYATLQQEKLPM